MNYKDGLDEVRFLFRDDNFVYLVGIFCEKELGKVRCGVEFKFEVFFVRWFL